MKKENPKGYMYAELKIRDHEYFEREYLVPVLKMLDEFGAKFVVKGGAPEVLEGGRDVPRVVVIEFESVDKVHEFYNMAAYQKIIKHRFDACEYTHLYVLEGSNE